MPPFIEGNSTSSPLLDVAVFSSPFFPNSVRTGENSVPRMDVRGFVFSAVLLSSRQAPTATSFSFSNLSPFEHLIFLGRFTRGDEEIIQSLFTSGLFRRFFAAGRGLLLSLVGVFDHKKVLMEESNPVCSCTSLSSSYFPLETSPFASKLSRFRFNDDNTTDIFHV